MSPYWLSKYTLDQYSPHVAAEDMPLVALVDFQPGTSNTTAMASHSAEMAIRVSNVSQMNLAQISANHHRDNPYSGIKARTFVDCMPLFRARVDGVHPTINQIGKTLLSLNGTLQHAQDLLSKKDAEIAERFEQSADKGRDIRSQIQGYIGETLLLALGAELAYGEYGDFPVLFPSSWREETMPVSKKLRYQMPRSYAKRLHDVHSFNPGRPSSRDIFSVKTSRGPDSSGGCTAKRYNVLQEAKKSMAKVDGVEYSCAPLPDIVQVLSFALTAAGLSDNRDAAIHTQMLEDLKEKISVRGPFVPRKSQVA